MGIIFRNGVGRQGQAAERLSWVVPAAEPAPYKRPFNLGLIGRFCWKTAQQELRPTAGARVDGVGRASFPASRLPDEERFFSGTNRPDLGPDSVGTSRGMLTKVDFS